MQPAHPRSPADKGIVERTGGSINTLFCQHVAGYVPVVLTGDDCIELLPAAWRTINDYGVRLDISHLRQQGTEPLPTAALRRHGSAGCLESPARSLRRPSSAPFADFAWRHAQQMDDPMHLINRSSTEAHIVRFPGTGQPIPVAAPVDG